MRPHKPLLFEIGCAEMPALMLQSLSQGLLLQFKDLCAQAGLNFQVSHSYTTPRRLALLIEDFPLQKPAQKITRKGPAVKAAFDANGKPTPALLGFAKSVKADIADLVRRDSDKGEFLFFDQMLPAEKVENLLPALLENSLKKLPITKPMRWGDAPFEFIRPVQWLVLLFGDQVINQQMIFGRLPDRLTYGHRLMHPKAISLENPLDYAATLAEKGFVIADFAQRKQIIMAQMQRLRQGLGQIVLDEKLLTEVTGLVEWPKALLGSFAPSFLSVPKEALVTAMQQHQKSFALVDAKNQLLPHFISIANLESHDEQRVIAGNERVMAARLSDAKFFYEQDLKHSLQARLDSLKTVVFQTQLGNLYERACRISELAGFIAEKLALDVQLARRAGLLAKTDLMTNMVGEFPELQGVMGYYYARKDGEPEAVALAIKAQYLPRFSGDQLPQSNLSASIAVAEKLDTLVGIFGINQIPSGDKDPFALRRAALGMLRILIEKSLDLDLVELLAQAKSLYANKIQNQAVVTQCLDFIYERLRALYRDQNIASDVYQAVRAVAPSSALDFDIRIQAVNHFKSLKAAENLIAANKRVSHILKQAGEVKAEINPNLFAETAEQDLFHALKIAEKNFSANFSQKNYTAALSGLASLQPVVDGFFDQVMVMAKDQKLQHNRLALLQALRRLFLQIADISCLA